MITVLEFVMSGLGLPVLSAIGMATFLCPLLLPIVAAWLGLKGMRAEEEGGSLAWGVGVLCLPYCVPGSWLGGGPLVILWALVAVVFPIGSLIWMGRLVDRNRRLEGERVRRPWLALPAVGLYALLGWTLATGQLSANGLFS
jgi:hypothetical protein